MAAAEPWTHHEAVVNNVRLHYVEQGTGPLVLLLHGFPEFWYAWRHQIPTLAAAGFRVVAPDLRGYNLSDKPKEMEAYALKHVVEDVVALIHHLGERKAHVAGHDWGGIAGWWLAMLRAEALDRLVTINAPHPRIFAREFSKPKQILKSWYALFFQLPVLPEAALGAGTHRWIERMLRHDPVRPNAYTEEDIRRYKEALAQPGAVPAMLNYYRAARRVPRPKTCTVEAPTLVIWGDRDAALNIENSQGLEKYVTHVRVEHIPDASHWVLADAPERVNELMIPFLKGA